MHLATTAKLNYPPVALLHCKATEATRTHLDARKPAPGKANGGAGIWGRRPLASRLMPSGRTIHWALPRGYESNRRSHSNHCGGDRDRVRPTSRPSSKLEGCGRVRKAD